MTDTWKDGGPAFIEGAGLKQDDITPCIGCGKGVMHDNQIIFYRVCIHQLIADLSAIQRQTGMEMMMGAAAPLAAIMGPNEDMAKALSRDEGLVCLECSMDKPLAHIIELLAARTIQGGRDDE